MKIKKSHINVSLFIFILSVTIASSMNPQYKLEIPKSSADEINIATPENKIYTEPDIGHFPGSYGFENDQVGQAPSEWVWAAPNGYVRVLDEIDGFKKVLETHKNSGGTPTYITKYFEEESGTTGTVEFWLRKDTISGGADASKFALGSSGTGHVALGFQQGDIYRGDYGTSGDWIKIADNAYVANEWYHVRIDFDLTQGWQVKFNNGTVYGAGFAYPFDDGTPNAITYFHQASHYSGDHPSYSTFHDAISYSWDPRLEIGDNLEEGLLLSYDSTITLDWQGYSLDGQENQTIFGNTTISTRTLSNGLHSIQVFGNNSLGTMYQSDIRYFNINYYNNNPPEFTDGDVSPRIGDQTTEFNFTVIYKDQDGTPPIYVNVVINGTVYAMEKTFPSDDNYTNGCYYDYATFLMPSEYNYTYYFECSDGKFTNASIASNNLKVNKGNYNSPQLLFPEVSLDYGGLTTDFVFNIWYYDLDDNYPIDINITIDTSTYPMIQVNSGDTNATDGIEFSYTTNLDQGIHKFQFNCSDGLYSNSTNWIIGPEVNPLYGIDPIELIAPSTCSQVFSNLLDFSWSSLDAGYGAVNFTLQVSNITDFSYMIFQSDDITETPIVTNFSIPLSITHGDYYWRVKPRFGEYNGSWSSYAKFTYMSNENTPYLVLNDITPTEGTSSTIFTFTVIYTDLDNNAPEYVEILINGIPHSMDLEDPLDDDFTDGCIYQYITLLAPSTTAYAISFECSDGAFQCSTSTHQGPLVEADSTPGDNQGDDSFNSANTFAITMILGIMVGSILPFIAFAEIKARKIKKLGDSTPTKIKKKELITKF